MASPQYTHYWKTSAETRYLILPNGAEVRFMVAGSGQPLLLLHPLRGQLDYFKKLIPLLLDDGYRVVALDLPGFGYSTLPGAAIPDEPYLRASVVAFMEALDLKNTVLLGESIGGTLALTVAATVPGRVARVAAINPYDYGERFGGGIRRGHPGPILGLLPLLRQFTPAPSSWLRRMLLAGVSDPAHLPEALVAEYDEVGHQAGYRRVEYLFYKCWQSWTTAPQLYPKVTAPVTLVYGEQDWSRPDEREHRSQILPQVDLCTLTGAGHFLSLERPEQVAALVGGDLLG